MRTACALLLTLFVFALVGLAGPFSGQWDTALSFAVLPGGGISSAYLSSTLLAAYEAYGWTGAAAATFNIGSPFVTGPSFDSWSTVGADGFSELVLYADGGIGAFTLGSLALFDAMGEGSLRKMQGFATIALGSAQLYGFVAYDSLAGSVFTVTGTGTARNGDDESSLGGVVGAYGWAGPCWLGAEIGLGLEMYSSLWTVFYGIANGDAIDIETIWHRNEACKGAYLYPEGSCEMTFTSARFFALFPFTCFDVFSAVTFDCEAGFNFATFSLLDVDLGLSWVELEEVDVRFSAMSKAVVMWFDATLLDTVCIIPYVSIGYPGLVVTADSVIPRPVAPHVIDVVSLDALLLEYSAHGITVIITEMLSSGPIISGMYLSDTGRPCEYGLSWSCRGDLAPWPAREAIGIEIDGDGCCGAPFSAGFYSFFTTEAAGGIFDWVGTIATVEYGLSETVAVSEGLQVGTAGLESFEIGFQFTWGVPPDYGDCCMRAIRQVAVPI